MVTVVVQVSETDSVMVTVVVQVSETDSVMVTCGTGIRDWH